jgi:DNA-binding CsgD family transcriptional regulator
MISATELSSLLANLYATPLEPERWNLFLDTLCSLTNSSSGYVMGAYQEAGNVILAGGGQSHDAEFFRLYTEQYGSSDPFRPGLAKLPTVGVNHGAELVDQTAVRKTEFYNDLLMEYDMEYMTLLLCNFSEVRTEGLSLWRSRNYQSVSKESDHLLEMLMPHLKMVLALRSKISLTHSFARFSSTVMDAMSVAALLVDGRGRVLQMNRLAEAHLAAGNGLLLCHGYLQSADPKDTDRLNKLLASVTVKPQAGSSPGGAIRVARQNASALHVSAIPIPGENTFGDRDRYAVVFLYDQSEPQGSRSTTMRQLYKISPAEARIADLLCSGFDIKEISNLLQVTLETARFHVKQILKKTGVRRQAELVGLMLSLPAMPEGKRQP